MSQALTQVLERVPQWVHVLPIVSVITGVTLWLMGARLIRGAATLSSLLMGAIWGLGLGSALNAGGLLVLWVAGGAVIGGAMAWLLYRFWMAAMVSWLLMLAGPAAYMVLHELPAPPAQAVVDAQAAQRVEQAAPEVVKAAQSDEPMEAAVLVQKVVTEAYGNQASSIAAWWRGLSPGAQQGLMVASAGGAALGVALGLWLPTLCAATLTAFGGAVMMMLGAHGMMLLYAPEQTSSLQANPRLTVVLLGLISLGGAVMQWSMSKRPADTPG